MVAASWFGADVTLDLVLCSVFVLVHINICTLIVALGNSVSACPVPRAAQAMFALCVHKHSTFHVRQLLRRSRRRCRRCCRHRRRESRLLLTPLMLLCCPNVGQLRANCPALG